MKYIYTIVLTIFLASCTTSNVENNTNEDSPIVEITNNDIESELENLLYNEDSEITKSEVIKLNSAYRNPAWKVDMVVSYSVDENGFITTISADATKYNVSSFNEWLQSLVGKTLEDAESFQLAGSSIASEAFTFALKNN